MADNEPTPADKPAPLRISVFSTGTVILRNAQRSQPLSALRPVLLRRLASFTDTTWTPPMPVSVFVIHHAQGPILFDTGESPCFNDADYLPFWNVLPKHANKFTIAPGDGVVPQLHRLGIDPKDLQAIVLSHLHHDHAGGLEALREAAPDVPVIVGGAHWRAFGLHPVWAAVQGCAPNHWPAGFEPRVVEAEDVVPPEGNTTSTTDNDNLARALKPWTRYYPITSDNRVVAVDTPGHVPGHLSLIVLGAVDDATGKETTYFLAGDATYGTDLLDAEAPDGINDDPYDAVRSLRRIKEFCADESREVVVLASHEEEVERMLKERVLYRPKNGDS